MSQINYTSNKSPNNGATANEMDEALKSTNIRASPLSNDVPVAICGMGMRLPGGICNDVQLFEFLMNKKNARSTVPQNRFNSKAYYFDGKKPGMLASKWGYFLQDGNFANFDISMFSMTESEVVSLDPNQRLLLQVVREAFESAGEANFRGAPIATYACSYSEDWQSLQNADLTYFNPYQLTGQQDFMMSNRIAWEYDLRGPSMTIKSACSSSGVALHQALQTIRLGETDSAIVTGASIFLDPRLSVNIATSMALSPDGFCRTFDAGANGFGRAEGVCCLYIKRLDKALTDGNPIRAIIRASASNSDGRGPARFVPSPVSQEVLIRQAYRSASLSFNDTTVVECHGTGTPVGDRQEVAAIARCFGERGVYIGSVKTNLGHAEGAACLTGIIKAVLSLEKKIILPSVNFVNRNPEIPWDEAKLKVPVEPLPWPEGCKEQMSVNSFGIGGSNAHIVLQSARSMGIPSPQSLQSLIPKGKRLLLLSAGSAGSLQTMIQNYQKYLADHPERVDSVAYNLSERRERLKHRIVCIADETGASSLITPLSSQIKDRSGVAYIFTGQGAHWIHMGRELMQSQQLFRDTIREIDEVLHGLEHCQSWTVEETLLKCDDISVLSRPQIAQPVCTALQVALVRLLSAWGIEPTAAIGHSGGETAAAYAAGAFSLRDAIITAFYRGYVSEQLPKVGAMAAVAMGAEEAKHYLKPGTVVACENSAKNITISGDVESVNEVLEKIVQDHPNLFIRKLNVKQGYHSHHMLHVGQLYRDLLKKHLSPQTPKIPFYSSVYSRLLSEATDFGPEYWKNNLENPVLFHASSELLLKMLPEVSIHLEIGPHSTLGGPLRQTYAEKKLSILYTSALVRSKDSNDTFLDTVAQMFCAGVDIKLPRVQEVGVQVLTDLPLYPWHFEKEYWNQSRIASVWRFRRHPSHDLLGLRVPHSSDIEPSWRNLLRLADVSWIRDHRIGENIVLPAAAYVAMAGAAVCQLLDGESVNLPSNGASRELMSIENRKRGQICYTIRNLQLLNAMLLDDDTVTEIITSLRPKKLTTSLENPWHEFSIISFNGTAWTTHCTGLVAARANVTASLDDQPKTQKFTKKISATRLYKTMRQTGLNFGPRFTCLRDITASVSNYKAAAQIIDFSEPAESTYPMHPATIDAFFQSTDVAQIQGSYRKLTSVGMPVFIPEIFVASAPSATIDCVASGSKANDRVSYGMVDGNLVFRMSGMEIQSISDESQNERPSLTTQVLQWRASFDFADAASLMKPRHGIQAMLSWHERLFVLCTSELHSTLITLKPSQPHFVRYTEWLKDQYQRFQQPGYPLVEDSAAIVQMDSLTRRQLLTDSLQQNEDPGTKCIATAIERCFTQMADIVEGRVDYLDLLLKDNILGEVYDCLNRLVDLSAMFSLLGNSQPSQRVLEIGAGTGSLTSHILQSLKSEFGERLFSSYTYTDISAGFFGKAQERFTNYDAIQYKVLDISTNPLEQGFEAESFDLIIASNVLHATPLLGETLRNCRMLLRPQGRLFLQELSPVVKFANFIMGLFSGWWLGEADGRIHEPFISPEAWDTRLREAGFSGIAAMKLDGNRPYYMNANILSQPIIEAPPSPRITLLTHSLELGPLARETRRLLQASGYNVYHCTWRTCDIPANQNLISFLDVEDGSEPLLKNVTDEVLANLLGLVRALSKQSILWLMRSAQITCHDPHQGQILGLARTIRTELATTFATMELDKVDISAATAICRVVQNLGECEALDAGMDRDMEFVWADNEIQISRAHWVSVKESLARSTCDASVKRLVIGKPGLLQTLHWQSCLPVPLGRQHVRVRVATLGVNFRDLMVILGTIPGKEAFPDGSIPLTCFEGGGSVTEVGADVWAVKVGDRVAILGSVPLTETVVTQEQCVKIPDSLSDDEVASMLTTYGTALHCLVRNANLRKGQSILIHNAAGGVGIAAIQVARWIGAQIYATTSNEEKVTFLNSTFGIARDRIFQSRNDSFRAGVMSATGGVGVDVVLSAMSGELLHASWHCVAPRGIMVDISKRDSLAHGQLDMYQFSEGCTFSAFNGLQLMSPTGGSSPLAIELMHQIVDLYERGYIAPVRPISLFDAANVQSAYRYMQQGHHMGKIVLHLGEKEGFVATPSVPLPSFREDASYLLVGGMGGLGKAIASWMASNGAKQIIFLSRSAGQSDEDQALRAELEEFGCASECYAGNVSDAAVVASVVENTLLPIAGVLQLAMVLRDKATLEMDIDSWTAATRPKIAGTWNLHSLLPETLDFFVLFSSISGMFGYPGQANYASACSFLDAFAEYRHSLGRVASVIDVGPIDDVGHVASTTSSRENMPSGTILFSEQEFLDTLQLAMMAPPLGPRHDGSLNKQHILQLPSMSVPIGDTGNSTLWKRDRRIALRRNLEATSSTELNESWLQTIRSYIRALAADPRKLDDQETLEFLAYAIRRRAAAFVMKDDDELDLKMPLRAIGVDSLVAIELRNWVAQSLGVYVSMLELVQANDFWELARVVTSRLKERYAK